MNLDDLRKLAAFVEQHAGATNPLTVWLRSNTRGDGDP